MRSIRAAREKAPDCRLVLCPQIVGKPAANKQRRPVICHSRRHRRKADQRRHLALDRLEVDPPARRPVLEDQVLQQKGALRRVRHRRLQSRISLGPAPDAGKVETAHRAHHPEVARLIGDRRNVGNDEAFDQVGVAQRRHHRDLPAHAVPEQREAVMSERRKAGAHIIGHLAIGHRLGPGRGAVIAQIECDDPMVRAEPLRD